MKSLSSDPNEPTRRSGDHGRRSGSIIDQGHFANDVPLTYGLDEGAANVWVCGIPSISAVSFSCSRVNVVHAEATPRARSASINDQVAGRIEPHIEACVNTSSCAKRPAMHGIT